MIATHRNQAEFSRLMRVIALSCIVLALFMTGLEAMHAHSDAVASNSSPCVICLSIHANAPRVSVQVLPPQFHVVEAVAIPYQTEGKSAISDLSLFIRPPPVA